MPIITIVVNSENIPEPGRAIKYDHIIQTSLGNALKREELLTRKCQLLQQPYATHVNSMIDNINQELIKDIQEQL